MNPYLSVARSVVDYKFHVTPPYPLRFIVNITGACQSLCKTCNWGRNYLDGTYQTKDELTLSEYDHLFSTIPNLVWFTPSGGEPFMRPNFADIVKSAEKNCPHLLGIDSSSNGISPTLTLNTMKEILTTTKVNFELGCSLDGDRDTNDFIRGQKGNFDSSIKMFHALEALSKEYPQFHTHINHTISGLNAGKTKDFISSLKQEGIEINPNTISISLAIISHVYETTHGRTTGSAFTITDKKQAQRDVQCIIDSCKESTAKGFLQNSRTIFKTIYLNLSRDKYFGGEGMVLPCAAIRLSAFMSAKGGLFPCTMEDTPLGNIRDYHLDFREAWNSPAYKAFRKRLWKEGCACKGWNGCESVTSELGALPFILRKAL